MPIPPCPSALPMCTYSSCLCFTFHFCHIATTSPIFVFESISLKKITKLIQPLQNGHLRAVFITSYFLKRRPENTCHLWSKNQFYVHSGKSRGSDGTKHHQQCIRGCWLPFVSGKELVLKLLIHIIGLHYYNLSRWEKEEFKFWFKSLNFLREFNNILYERASLTQRRAGFFPN